MHERIQIKNKTWVQGIGAWPWIVTQLKCTYVSELDFSYLSQSTDNLTPYLVGDVKLGQGHVRRAEQGILGNAHDEKSGPIWPKQESVKGKCFFLT